MSLERKQTNEVATFSMPDYFKTELFNIDKDFHENGKLLSDEEIRLIINKNLPKKLNLPPNSGVKLSKRHRYLKDTALENKYSLIVYLDSNSHASYWLRFGSSEKKNKLGAGANKKQKLAQNLETGEWKKISSGSRDALKKEREFTALLGRTHMESIEYKTVRKEKTRWNENETSEIKIITVPEHKKSLFISDLIPGENLYSIAKQYYQGQINLSLADWQHILIQVMENIIQLHDKNWLHCDIKSANFIYDWNTQIVKVIDFEGMLKLCGEDKVLCLDHLTTLLYRAPEILPTVKKTVFIENKKREIALIPYSKKSDIYSCGVLLNELLGKMWIEHKGHWRENLFYKLRNQPEMQVWLKAIKEMTNRDPNKRPDLKTIIAQLKPLCQPIPKKSLKSVSLFHALKETKETSGFYKPYEKNKVIFVDTQESKVNKKNIITLRNEFEKRGIPVATTFLKSSSLQHADCHLAKFSDQPTKDLKDEKEIKNQRSKTENSSSTLSSSSYSQTELKTMREKGINYYNSIFAGTWHENQNTAQLLSDKIKTIPDDYFIAINKNFLSPYLILPPIFFDDILVLEAYWIFLIDLFQQVFPQNSHITYQLLEDIHYRENVIYYIEISIQHNFQKNELPINNFPFLDLELGKLVFANKFNADCYHEFATYQHFDSTPAAARDLFKTYLGQLQKGASLKSLLATKSQAETAERDKCESRCIIM